MELLVFALRPASPVGGGEVRCPDGAGGK